MSITGIDALVFGVEDLKEATRFFADWGLRRLKGGRGGAVFEAQNGAQVILRPADDPGLPPAIEPGSTLREVVWGVRTARDLARLATRLGDDAHAGADGVWHGRDPMGLAFALRVSRRRALKVPPVLANAPGAARRVDVRGPLYDRARPLAIGHLVLFVPELAAMERFYRETLGFLVSDRYPAGGVFLRCQPRGPHHTLFMLERPGKAGLNHVAFPVRDIHEVMGGGLHIGRRGWRTQLGPGRHPISSAYFWYVHSPAGGQVEYFADEDHVTEKWRPRTWKRTPENFAEWAIAGGLDPHTRRQRAPTP